MSGQGLTLSGTFRLLASEGCIRAKTTVKKTVKLHPFLGGKWQQPCRGAGTKELLSQCISVGQPGSLDPSTGTGRHQGTCCNPNIILTSTSVPAGCRDHRRGNRERPHPPMLSLYQHLIKT